MKYQILLVVFMAMTSWTYGQTSSKDSLISVEMTPYSSDEVLTDIMRFQGIQYINVRFTGKALGLLSYRLSVKEIWDGKITQDSVIVNTAEIPIPALQVVGDTILEIAVISTYEPDSTLKMSFQFPRFGVDRKFKSIASESYSLRPVKSIEQTGVKPEETFYLLTYILPYEENGRKYWCAVESSGEAIESWGESFGIPHYLVFEMTFVQP